ncbi:MAG: SUMF1/EgtB/PvdO family nonheme iron enzyme [Synergistes sp.]|nr:SUMF1/EgtB/PvdO family nonheme iron enzyme [Synergistes sp.]
MKKIVFAALLLVIATAYGCPAAAPDAKEFVFVRGGAFTMGSPASEGWRGSDETQHKVTVGDFYMGRREVTQAEYSSVMNANPSNFKGERLPVENVSWIDAVRYCNARSKKEGLAPVYTIDGSKVTWDRKADGYRLPTEAEWEYACRAGTDTPFNTKTSIGADEANYYGHYPYGIEENYFNQGKLSTKPGIYRGETVNVGSFKPNALGLYDMHGNVAEWCWDVYGPYGSEARKDPTGPAAGSRRVNRGGGWNDFAKNIRSAYRAAAPQENRTFNLGFRLVRGASGAGPVAAAAKQENKSKGSKALVAYFSWGGNTRGIAREIQKQSGADIFEIQPEKPYSGDYNTVLSEAQRDQRVQARPKLKGRVKDMELYDVIILGYPNWWASIPMPVASFLEEYDLSGKTIMPFCSHGGGRFGQSLTAIAKLAPNSVITDGLSVHYSGGSGLRDEIARWLAAHNAAHR